MDAIKTIRKLIRENINNLFENVQLADKVYFKPGKLSEKVKDIIVSKITGGDNYTKIITDIYYEYLQQSVKHGKWALSAIDGSDYNAPDEEEVPENDVLDIETLREIKQLYHDLKEYNANVFPVKDLDIYKPKNISNIISCLNSRKKILENFKKLPSIAWRNMKSDIRQERDWREMQEYNRLLEYFLAHYSLIGNRNEELQSKILQKMFKTDTNLDQLLRFAEEKENLLGGMEFTKEKVKEMAEVEDFEVVYEKGDAMIVKVESPEGIKAIGCNSLWCFTYGTGFDTAYRQWGQYSHNDSVYVIIDFRFKSDDPDFMHVLIRPLVDENGRFLKFTEDNEDQHPLFNMANENWQNPYSVLNYILGKNYKSIVKNIMNFEY